MKWNIYLYGLLYFFSSIFLLTPASFFCTRFSLLRQKHSFPSFSFSLGQIYRQKATNIHIHTRTRATRTTTKQNPPKEIKQIQYVSCSTVEQSTHILRDSIMILLVKSSGWGQSATKTSSVESVKKILYLIQWFCMYLKDETANLDY